MKDRSLRQVLSVLLAERDLTFKDIIEMHGISRQLLHHHINNKDPKISKVELVASWFGLTAIDVLQKQNELTQEKKGLKNVM